MYLRRDSLEELLRMEVVIPYDASLDWGLYRSEHTRDEAMRLMAEYLPVPQRRLTVVTRDRDPEGPDRETGESMRGIGRKERQPTVVPLSRPVEDIAVLAGEKEYR